MSLKQIADMVGTSPSTVSRVLNNSSQNCASRELKDKIWAAARKTGYCPNEAARSLRKTGGSVAKLPSISIVFARIASLDIDPFFAELFRSLEAELMRRGAVIGDVVYAGKSPSLDLARSDGVIILGRCSEKLLCQVKSQNRNIVGIWRNSMNFNIDEVVCDGQKAAEIAMGHLISLGHRKIAYIGDCSFEQRYVGYCSMLIQNNIPIDYQIIKQTNQTRQEATAALYELLAAKERGETDFGAILCANDNTAVRVLEILRERKNYRRQKPVSVISIDDIEEAQNTKPFLTTVHIPHGEMAHMGVLLLLDRIAKGHREAVRSEFPCHIVERSSCFPA